MDVIMPQLGETLLEGTVITWYKKAGDPVTVDEPLFEVETDKATMEIPAPVSGVISEILVEPGVPVAVGARLAVIDTADESIFDAVSTADASNARVRGLKWENHARRSRVPLQRFRFGQQKLSPVVKGLLREHGIEPQLVPGTGKDGRITRQDVLAYFSKLASVSSGTPEHLQPIESVHESSSENDDLVVPLSKIRRVTGAHMVRSKAISPHALQAVEVDFHNVDEARRAFSARWKAEEGYSLTYLPFISQAVCKTIVRFPHVNASLGNDELIVHKRVHLGIAVDLDFEGLTVVVIHDADKLSLRKLAAETHRLAKEVRCGVLRLDELTGSTYTISNSGSFGTYFSSSIINQPQVAILSTDAVRKKPSVIEGPEGDEVVIRPIGVLTQSFDHRAFDGAYSAAFLGCLKKIIEESDWVAELE